MLLDLGRRAVGNAVSFGLSVTNEAILQLAAVASALYCFTQLLYDEDPLLDAFVQAPPLEGRQKGEDMKRVRRWTDCKGVYTMQLQKSTFTSAAERSAFNTYACLLQHLQGIPHVFQHVTHAEQHVFGNKGEFLLITERLQGGDSLTAKLRDKDVYGQMQVRDRMDMARQVLRSVLQGLAGMHERHIAHGNVTPDALYAVSSKDETGCRSWEATIIDFSSTSEFGQDDKVMNGSLVDLSNKDLDYVAPEVLILSMKGPDAGFPISAPATDMWSAGVLLFAVASGRKPFPSSNAEDVEQLVRQHRKWGAAARDRHSKHPLLKVLDEADPTFASLVLRLLQLDPVRRISAKDALKHEFFTNTSAAAASSASAEPAA